jgi:hypothetical protein
VSADGTQFSGKPGKVPTAALFGIGLAGVASVLRMIGEFSREAAVLLLIFVPLEVWRPHSPSIMDGHWGFLITGTALLLVFGIVLEIVALGFLRIKRNVEEGE